MDYIKIRFGPGFTTRFATDVSRTLDNLMGQGNPLYGSSQTWRPGVDILETPDEVFIVADVAGVPREEILVEIEARALRISGHRQEPPRDPSARFHRAEIAFGPFERIVFLPAPIDPEVVSAACADGLLQVRMAKQKPPLPQRVVVRSY